MPQLNSVVLTDGATTHTFEPNGIVGNVATLVESNGVPIADRRITIGQTRTATGRTKVTINFVIPEVQDVVVNGVSRPTLVRTAYANLVMTYDQTSNAAERAELTNLLESFFGTTLATATLDNLQTLY